MLRSVFVLLYEGFLFSVHYEETLRILRNMNFLTMLEFSLQGFYCVGAVDGAALPPPPPPRSSVHYRSAGALC